MPILLSVTLTPKAAKRLGRLPWATDPVMCLSCVKDTRRPLTEIHRCPDCGYRCCLSYD